MDGSEAATLSKPARETVGQLFLAALVAAPGVASAIVLAISFRYDVPAIASSEHFGPLAGRFLPCTGCGLCGMSRAFAAFSHGHWEAALSLNAGVAVLWPMAWLVIGVSLFGVYRLWRHPVRFFVAAPRNAQGAVQ
ncbi:MAG: DUF2752 domain-containing protein [Myxococcota bacterium]